MNLKRLEIIWKKEKYFGLSYYPSLKLIYEKPKYYGVKCIIKVK